MVEDTATLYCPIMMEHFGPGEGSCTPCCTQTLSSKAWDEWTSRNPTCPFCSRRLKCEDKVWRVDDTPQTNVPPSPNNQDPWWEAEEEEDDDYWVGFGQDEDEEGDVMEVDRDRREPNLARLLVDPNEFRPRWDAQRVDELMEDIEKHLRKGGAYTAVFEGLGECNVLRMSRDQEEEAETCWKLSVEPCLHSPYWTRHTFPANGEVSLFEVMCHEHNVVNVDRFEVY